jgi:hypothetical protein
VNCRLTECSSLLNEAEMKIEQEKRRNALLEVEKEELRELLTLEELRNRLAISHVAKMNVLVNQLKRDEGAEIDEIEEKDEIIMINEELELELANKNIVISQLQTELAQIKLKMAELEERTHKGEVKSNVAHEPQFAKKLPFVPSRDLEKVKSERKLFDKNTPNWNKKQEDNAKETTKETNNTK